MKKRSLLMLILSVCMLLVFSGCGKTEDVKDNSEKEEITMVLDWTPNTNHTGLYVAKELGYYEEAGLDVSIIQPPEDGASVMVASGQAQFGVDFQDYLTPIYSGETPLPITTVAAIIQHNSSGIISSKDSGIVSPKEMQGHSYATWELEIEKAILKYLVEKEGGDFAKVELIPSTVTDVVTALKMDDNIDCIWVYYGWDGIATEQAGLETNFFRLTEFGEALDYYSPVIVGNNEYMEENPEKTKAFLEATRKGYEYAIENPDEAAQILLKYAPELDEELVVASQRWLANEYRADAQAWGVIDGERWDAFYAWLYENGVIENPIEAGTGYTNKYWE